MIDVNVKVEYCGVCGYKKRFLEMVDIIKQNVPNANVTGVNGREASFEILINNELVYSKLQTMAFPDFNAVSEAAKDVSEGKPVTKVTREQPITDCAVS